MMGIGCSVIAFVGSPTVTSESSIRSIVPPRPEVDEVAVLLLAREAKRWHRTALHHAPGVVVDRALDDAAVVERLPYAAQRVAPIPGLGAARAGIEPLVAVDVVRPAATQHLTEWCSQILDVARGRAAERLGDERAVAIVAVGARAAASGVARHAAECIIRVTGRAVAQEVACIVIRPTDDLIGGVVGAPAVGAVARAIVAVGVLVGRRTTFLGSQQAVEAVVAVAQRARAGRLPTQDKF